MLSIPNPSYPGEHMCKRNDEYSVGNLEKDLLVIRSGSFRKQCSIWDLGQGCQYFGENKPSRHQCRQENKTQKPRKQRALLKVGLIYSLDLATLILKPTCYRSDVTSSACNNTFLNSDSCYGLSFCMGSENYYSSQKELSILKLINLQTFAA